MMMAPILVKVSLTLNANYCLLAYEDLCSCKMNLYLELKNYLSNICPPIGCQTHCLFKKLCYSFFSIFLPFICIQASSRVQNTKE